ncbi:MAG: ABC transporter substrate-binding protein, partial [Bacteroidales bacterium]|nr:ABC transporter substrate-binding protein [Bacteroidales bacterium]
ALTLPFKGVSQNQTQHPVEHPPENGHIAIGLLLPDHSQHDVINAAELAIEQANAAGGYMNQEFKLVIRTAEGFWGAGSKESVSLVYEDQVRAIIGSLDGRNGHLAEQVATKSHLTYIETYATDPTLSQAFVPWFMRVVPNDDQQSAVILNQIRKEGGDKIGILAVETYDTRYALKSLTKTIAQKTGMAPLVINLDTTDIQQQKVMEQIISSQLDHLIIPFDAAYLRELIQGLGELKPDLKIYGTLHLTMGVESRESTWKAYEGMYMIGPLLDRDSYPSLPDSRSAYMFDAVNLVINAIHQVGTNREAITDYLSSSSYSKGVTGSITFDVLGNRLSVPPLLRIENRVPRLINYH